MEVPESEEQVFRAFVKDSVLPSLPIACERSCMLIRVRGADMAYGASSGGFVVVIVVENNAFWRP